MGILAIGTRALGYTLIPGVIVGAFTYYAGKGVAAKEFEVIQKGLEHEINVLTKQVVQDTETFVDLDRKSTEIQKQQEEMRNMIIRRPVIAEVQKYLPHTIQ